MEEKGKHSHGAPHSPELWAFLKPLAQEMRREPTPTEEHLWKHLRDRKLHGYKFRRQAAILKFITDFYCAKARLIVELDGAGHDPEYDALRTHILNLYGLEVIRFKNEEVWENIDAVLAEIYRNLTLKR